MLQCGCVACNPLSSHIRIIIAHPSPVRYLSFLFRRLLHTGIGKGAPVGVPGVLGVGNRMEGA